MTDEIIYPKITKTINYDKFVTHQLQPLKRVKVTVELVESLRKTNGNEIQPILVSKKTNQIIDGNRRAQACKIARVPLYIKYLDSEEEAAIMSSLNNTGRTWTTLNFIDHYARQNDDYMVLQTYMVEKKVNIELIRLFGGVSNLMIKNGASVSNLNYTKLERIRRLAVLISGIFDVTNTVALRAIYKLSITIPKFSLVMLTRHLKMQQKKNGYNRLNLIGIQTQLLDVLTDTYYTNKEQI